MSLAEEFEALHHLPANRFNPHAWIIGDPDIGEDVWIGAFTVIDGSGGLSIGAGCDISAGAQIYTHSTVERCVSGRVQPVRRAATTIGRNVHIGANAVILMGAQIGDSCVVGAGAVVTAGTIAAPFSVLIGVPAKVVPEAAHRFAD
ncbi:acyltransferase [Demequina sp. TTPB684]|uniref:acyltransferase n=1 Tax=unclassified Demequina TaxID=2620311 RepID=UPI001CF5AF4F|nr:MULTISPECIES: acyltransferase [unclassified Demequina]MCB2413610.1 acyltransferase [Demequina sp. TTPB684]UPU88266.1 acyltransferase [Demequina sp. TMPB413]